MGAWETLNSIIVRGVPGHFPSVPLHRQVSGALREAISTRLRPGARMPSSRGLARDLGVSRNTVLAAFDQLIAEGFLEPKPSSGTFVALTVPAHALRLLDRVGRRRSPDGHGRRLSARGLVASGSRERVAGPGPATMAFRLGTPVLDRFPRRLWARLLCRALTRSPAARLDYGEPAGYGPLREAIARHLHTTRGVRAEASQILIVEGAQQGLSLAATLLLDRGDAVWFEDPGYLGARAALAAAGARIVPVPVDAEGLVVAEAYAREPGARLAYVSPSHQYPLGGTLSLRRRLQLLDWADATGSWVVEDDYDAEFRYSGRALPAVQGLDQSSRVIYVGTFSKVLAPALRLGFLVLPSDLVAPFERARSAQDLFSPMLQQIALADFIGAGWFARHVRRVRALAGHRQRQVHAALTHYCGARLQVECPPSGLHLVGWLAPGLDDREIVRAAAARSIEVQAVSAHLLDPTNRPANRRHGLLFGYGGVIEGEIEPSASIVGELLTNCQRGRFGSRLRV